MGQCVLERGPKSPLLPCCGARARARLGPRVELECGGGDGVGKTDACRVIPTARTHSIPPLGNNAMS